LRNFSYATSNLVGSYAYYTVEMGIPFFIYGNKQKYINHNDSNICIGEWDPYKESKSYKHAHDIFTGLFTSITTEQMELVEKDLGIHDGISRWKMAQVLYVSFLKFFFSRNGFNHILSCTRKRILKISKLHNEITERNNL
jgi:hypothetical protein